jgi:5-methylcytosine-specific restriction endonuclease McrA
MNDYPPDWPEIAWRIKEAARWRCVRCHHPNDPSHGRTLTVHHLDRSKSNCEDWNLAALCQRCHLSVQARVCMEQEYMFDHAEWLRPFVEARKKALAAR